MLPPLRVRLARLLRHDTSLVKLVTSFGLLLLGVTMATGMGEHRPGYMLMEQAWPLQFWGVLYLGVGAWGVYGCVNRLPYWVRLVHTMGCMFLWAFVGLAQFADEPLPTRTLLALPALVDLWVLIKVVLSGSRKDGA